ncbi:fungal specific transcription factor [Aspergillus nomiae NRRL 13137]|uniref:Fungal specific transcription factor n=1 Tax=Aspergillus nomiae NRRL (strain ATCC 15546 / NRRL 13137 / CBS 260.88 / M93) TaxID=1509407 RepID=A0A0L1IQ29_ASPN3|nr:fungal specific transcription factor [Aspergillus nomiae NRRL 13137]KNG81604.1 fungal specific transcription factor [Aspergillus nomiae NRRL 13137]
MDRLKRLEEQVGLGNAPETEDNGDDSMSISSVGSEAARAISIDKDPAQVVPSVIRDIVSRIKDEGSRSMLLSNVFCHLRQVDSCYFENNRCIKAMTSAISEIESTQNHYGSYQFPGFEFPLEKSFLSSIPDLIEIPHVQLDCKSQIIYYSVLLRGILLEPEPHPRRGSIMRNLYLKCVALSDEWMKNIQDSPVDFLAASLMASASHITSTALEGYNTDLAWKAFTHTCRISKTLGYFSVDETPSEGDNQLSTPAGTPLHEAEVERNRKRFVFWHILRTDCLFRKSFGKPTLIPTGSWKVHLPDPTINGVDDESSRFIQIHFLISMRLGLIVRKYLDWIDSGPDLDPIPHDSILHTYIDEVQSILSDWDTAGLLRTISNHIDSWLCIDVLVGSYEILIVLHLSKKCHHGHLLPHPAVNLARKSLKIFQSLLGSTSHAFWGISPITMYQFLPFFILCLDIIENPDHENLDEDLVSVTWVCDYVEMAAEGRVELKPVIILIKAMVTTCQQTKVDRLVQSGSTGE